MCVGRAFDFYMPWSLITHVPRETHVGTKCTEIRCSVIRITAFQRCAYGGETENSEVSHLLCSVLKSTLTHACYHTHSLFLEHQVGTTHMNQIPVETAQVSTDTHAPFVESLPHWWFSRTSEAAGLFFMARSLHWIPHSCSATYFDCIQMVLLPEHFAYGLHGST